MGAYPVRYHVEKPARFTRLQLLIRVLASILVGIPGLWTGTLVFAYIALPLFAAVRLADRRDPAAYLDEDGPRIVRALGWFAAVFAWFGLTSDRLALYTPEETVRIQVERSGRPTARSALWRLLIGLPSALVLNLLGAIAILVWLWAAVSVLRNERVGDGAFSFLTGVQRWVIRLLAYQASLVEPYPPFSFDDTPDELPAAPAAR